MFSNKARYNAGGTVKKPKESYEERWTRTAAENKAIEGRRELDRKITQGVVRAVDVASTVVSGTPLGAAVHPIIGAASSAWQALAPEGSMYHTNDSLANKAGKLALTMGKDLVTEAAMRGIASGLRSTERAANVIRPTPMAPTTAPRPLRPSTFRISNPGYFGGRGEDPINITRRNVHLDPRFRVGLTDPVNISLGRR